MTFAPLLSSFSLRCLDIARLTVFSGIPVGPTEPDSEPPCPGSIAIVIF
jgi:hypothetical protein